MLGIGANGLGVLRALRNFPELDVWAVNFDKKDPGRFTRVARILDWQDSVNDRNEFQDRLHDVSKKHIRTILFPTRDKEVDLLADLSDSLPENLLYYRNSIGAVKALTDKRLLVETASRAGLFTPRTIFISEKINLQSAGFKFPVIIKPLTTYSSLTPFKTILVNNEEEFQKIFIEYNNLLHHTIVQEFIPGDDDQVHQCILLINDDEQTIGIIEFQKLRQYLPQKGIASYGQTILSRSLVPLSEQLAKQVGYKGLISAEFKRDSENGHWAFIEPNLRLPIFNAVFPPSGANLAYLYVKSLLEKVNYTVFATQTAKWMHEENDLANILTHKVQTPLNTWFKQLLKTNSFAFWYIKDPLPGLYSFGKIILICLKKTFLIKCLSSFWRTLRISLQRAIRKLNRSGFDISP